MDELLDDVLAPGPEGAPAEPARESLDAGEADAVNLRRVAVERDDARVDQNGSNLVLLSRFEVVIAEDRDRGDLDSALISRVSARASSARP